MLEAATAALKDNKPVRARRLAEEAARSSRSATERLGRARELAALVEALERAGAGRQALLLARTLAEVDREGGVPGGKSDTGAALAALIKRAAGAGERALATRWRADLPPALRAAPTPTPRSHEETERTPTMRFRAAQRAVRAGGNVEAAVARLFPVLDGHAGRAAALALGERLLGTLGGAPAQAMRAELLRLAFEGERAPARRQALALRWSKTLEEAGEQVAAVGAYNRAIAELPPDQSPALRLARAALLRASGRKAELARALDSDAEVAAGVVRAALRAEQARLLDELGEKDGALEVRLQALRDAPGNLDLLAPARQRLESVGRLDRSLELGAAAVPHVSDRGARAALLWDVATLAEASAGDRQRAALAWLEVLR